MPAAVATYPDLESARAVVTGGASGIGAALVEGFLAQGASVAFLDRDAQAGAETATLLGEKYGRPPLFLQCDLSNVEEARTATASAGQRLGGIDVLVNNVGWDDRHEFMDVTEDYWDKSMSVNLKAAFFVSQAAMGYLTASAQPAIVNFSSIAFMMNLPDMPVYLTAKSAIIGLTKAMAGRFGAEGVRVNAILPGMVLTPRQKALWVSDEAALAHMDKQCLKFNLEPEDMVGPCLFLASTGSRAITAQAIIADGGYF